MAEFILTPNNDIFPPDTLTNIFGDDIITGLAGDDSIDGGNGVDSVAGGDGNDTLIGGPAGTSSVIGSDTLDGGNGTDLADYLGASGAVTVNLTTGTASSAPDVIFDPISQILISIENVRGSNFNDTIIGDSGDNILDAAVGNDSVVGGAGNDILAGGTGNNTLDGGDGNDWVDYLSNVAPVFVNLETGSAFDLNDPGFGISDTLISIENIRGSTSGDTIFGSTGDNILEGGGGADSLQAGLGNDLYRLNSTTAGASQINDVGGTDTLNFTDDVSIALAAPTAGIIGLARDGTTLLLDTNQDGNANASDDVAIIDFFDASIPGAGTGFIESIQNLSGTDILSFFFGSIQFGASSFTVQEDGTVVQAITVTRTGGSSGEVSATVNLSDGTATAPGDYDNTPITVTFADGDAAAKTVTVPVVQDTVVEGTETVNLTLSTTSAATIGTQNSATLNILDDDTLSGGDDTLSGGDDTLSGGDDTLSGGTLQFSAPSFTVQEDGTVVQAITVTRTGGSSGAVTATVNLSDGTATAPGDYDNTPITVTFADGDTADKTVAVPVVQDTIFEGTETVNLTLSTTSAATIGTQNSATLNILDDDTLSGGDDTLSGGDDTLSGGDDTLSGGTLQFSAPSFTVQEDGTVVQAITVTRTGGSSGAVTATVTLTDGTATAPGDYDNQPLTVSFADGDTAAKTVAVPVVQDTLFEETETVNLTLANVTGGAVIGTQNTATLNITDDDTANPGTVSFDAPTVSVNENLPLAVVSINRTGGTDGAVSLQVNLRDGTATAGLDYVNSPSPQVVTFADGDAEPKPVSIPILDDDLVEGNETISVELTGVSGGVTAGVVSSLILQIVDNDVTPVLPGTLEFSAPTFSSIEGKPTAEITVNRTGGSDGAISANLVFTEGTAKAGVSFNASPIPVIFADGDATAKRVRIPIFDDAVVEDLPTFNVALADVTGGATVGAQSNAAVQIANNDAAPLALPLLGFEEFGNFQRFTSSGGLTFSDNAITLVAENQGGEGRFQRDTADSKVVAYDTGDSITIGLTDRLATVPGGITGGQISFRYASPNQSHQVRFFDAAGNQVGGETLNRTPGDRDNFTEFVNASFNFPATTRTIALGSTATQIGFDDIEVTLNPTLLTGEWQYTAPQDFTITSTGFTGDAPAFAAPLDIIQTGDSVTISGFYLNSTGTGSGQISGNQITATLPLSGGTGQLLGTISADGRTIQGNITFTSGEPGTSTATIPFTMSSQTGAGNDVISGDDGTNSLSAGIGNDSLTGGVGADTLTGGDGSDDFIFNNSGEGSDIITDFTPGEDQIVIAAAGFGGNLSGGAVLPAIAFALGTSASDSNQRFIYDSTTGGLFFDGDGNGPSSQVQLATLSGLPALSAADIFVV
ncbi:S-layer family protein [[Phormidium] sp. ETS-05]|uniref:beta strand repeat-containing protein n=1 Tax=[Phormidium] sp. ETS-05 TaxID=222819 RepID=UPI0018EF1262|nr:Calx-beta domain-containing protein [[Phormidium] sp. ETS-05]